jgi:hypothetical protein
MADRETSEHTPRIDVVGAKGGTLIISMQADRKDDTSYTLSTPLNRASYT